MKKLLAAAAAAGLTLGAFAGAANAEPITTPIGTATVNEGGYIVYAEGNDGNPGPIAGFVTVSNDGTVCADDNGNAEQSASATCAP